VNLIDSISASVSFLSGGVLSELVVLFPDSFPQEQSVMAIRTRERVKLKELMFIKKRGDFTGEFMEINRWEKLKDEYENRMIAD